MKYVYALVYCDYDNIDNINVCHLFVNEEIAKKYLATIAYDRNYYEIRKLPVLKEFP